MNGSKAREQATDQLEVCWRVTTASGFRFACCLYRSGRQVEARLTLGEATVVDSRTVATRDCACELAHRWLRAVIARHRAWS